MVNNRLNNSTQKLSNAKGGGIALALAAILLPACTTPQREATAPAPAPAPHHPVRLPRQPRMWLITQHNCLAKL